MSQEFEHGHQHVVSTSEPGARAAESSPGRASRSALMRKPVHPITSGLLSRAARDANGVAANADDAVAAASSSSGAPLPDALMRKFESSLGADLSGVRVHTGDTSAAANDAVGARAYTVGQDIHFGAGQYDPSSPTGEHLLAHEVAHTVQQAGGASRMQYKLEVSSPGDAHEHEADAAASAMVAGGSAAISGVQRQMHRNVLNKVGVNDVTFKVKERQLLGEEGTPYAYAKLKLGIAGSVTVKEQGEGKKKAEGAGPAETGVEVEKNGVGLSTKQKLEADWGVDPVIEDSVSFDEKGLHLKAAMGIEHDGVTFKGGGKTPVSIKAVPIDWNPPKEPEILAVEATAGYKNGGEIGGVPFDVDLTFTGVAQPDWKKILVKLGQMGAEAVLADMGAIAGAIAFPLGVFVGGLVGWAKAGHEVDGLADRVNVLKLQCEAVAREAITGKHVPMDMGFGDVGAVIGAKAVEARAAVAKAMGKPIAMLLATGYTDPVLVDSLADFLFQTMWPDVKTKLLAAYAGAGDYEEVRKYLDGYAPNSVNKMGQKV